MRDYEVVIIIQPDLDETATNAVVERVNNWITEANGQVVKTETWGKRRLAYEIRKQREGYYVLLYSQMDPAAVSELERNLQFLEPVLRFMITTND
jgi:small subunit ribosomal protein S6